MKVQEGNLLGSGKKFAIIGSRFNEFITSKLIGGAEDCLLRHDVKQEDITVIWVPGAYEIPLIAKKLPYLVVMMRLSVLGLLFVVLLLIMIMYVMK